MVSRMLIMTAIAIAIEEMKSGRLGWKVLDVLELQQKAWSGFNTGLTSSFVGFDSCSKIC